MVISKKSAAHKIDSTLYIRTADRETRSVPSLWLNYSKYLKELSKKDVHFGIELKPITLELDADAISMIGTCINFMEQDAIDALQKNYLVTLSLDDILKLYKAAQQLIIEVLLTVIETVLPIHFTQTVSLHRFAHNAAFLIQLFLNQDLKDRLKTQILTREDQAYLRSRLYTDLSGLFRTTCMQLNESGTTLVTGCGQGDKGSVDVWNLPQGTLHKRFDLSEPVRQLFFCRGPEVLSVGSHVITVLHLLNGSQTPIHFQGEQGASIWGAAQSDDMGLHAFGMSSSIFIARLGEKHFLKIPFSGRIHKHQVSNVFNPYLIFCGSDEPVLVCADSEGTLFFYCAKTGALLAEESIHTEKISHYIVLNNRCITFSSNGQVCLWDTRRHADKRLITEDRMSPGSCFLRAEGLAAPLVGEKRIAFVSRTTNPVTPSFSDASKHAVTYSLDRQRNICVHEEGHMLELPSTNTPEQLCMSSDQSYVIAGTFDPVIRVYHHTNPRIKKFLSEELSFTQALALQLVIQQLKKGVTATPRGSRSEVSLLRNGHIHDLLKSLPSYLKVALTGTLPELRTLLTNDSYTQETLTLTLKKPQEMSARSSSHRNVSEPPALTSSGLRRMVSFAKNEAVASPVPEVVDFVTEITHLAPDDSQDHDDDDTSSDFSSTDEEETSSHETLPRGMSAPEVLQASSNDDDDVDQPSEHYHTAAEIQFVEKKKRVKRSELQRRNTEDHAEKTQTSRIVAQVLSASNSPTLGKARSAGGKPLLESDQLIRRSTLPNRPSVATESMETKSSPRTPVNGSPRISSIPSYNSPRFGISQQAHVTLSLKYTQAKKAFYNGSFEEAFTLFSELLASEENPPEKRNAHWWLGELYLQGLGTSFDFAKARTHFAHAQSDSEDKELKATACERLGFMVFHGYGHEIDLVQAKRYALTALEQAKGAQTKALSAYLLARILSKEETPNLEEITSYEAIALASANVFKNQIPVPKAEEGFYHLMLGRIYLQGSKSIVNGKSAEQHLQEAIKSPNKFIAAEAYLLHGLLHQLGTIKKKKARESLKKVLELKINHAACAHAAFELGVLYSAEADNAKAQTFYTRAATQNYDVALQKKAIACLKR